MARYYGLVAGLPDLVLEGGRITAGSAEVLEELSDRLEGADRDLLACARFPYDNRNLIAVLEERQREFDPRGNYDRDALDQIVKTAAGCPAYMEDFLLARKDGRQLFQGLTAEDTLTWLFFDQMAVHPNAFIRDWFGFDQDIRNILAGLAFRAAQENREKTRPLERLIIGRSGASESILKSSAPDFSLTPQYPWIERLLAVKEEGLLERERLVDRVRWDRIDEMTMLCHFGAELVVGFFLKFCMAERWLKLDPEEGRKMLEKLSEQMAASLAEKTGTEN